MDFMTRMKQAISTSMEGSRDFLDKAREKVHDFGETSVIRIEIRQLENQAKQEMLKLGTMSYELLVEEGKGSISQKTPELKDVFQKLDELKQQITDKEKLLKQEEQEKKSDTK